MSEILLNTLHILEMILLISVLIIVHEAGHFFVARALKIKVDRVGLGLPIGPTLFQKKIGDITYSIHAFLLGGYVGFPDDDPESTVPLDDPDRIKNRPDWQKLCVVSAGVIMNAIFAYIIVLFVALGAKTLPSGNYAIIIDSVQKGEVAAKYAGFERNDRLVYMNGIKIINPMFSDEIAQRSKKFDGYASEKNIELQLENIKKANPKIKLDKNEKIPAGIVLTIPKAAKEDFIKIPDDFYLRKRPKPDGLELSEAQKKLRDKMDENNIYTSDNKFSLYEVAMATADTVHPLSIEVERKGKIVKLNDIYPDKNAKIGVYLKITEINEPINNVFDAVVQSNRYIVQNTKMMIDGLVKLVIGKVAADNMHGIVAIVKIGADTIERSIWDGFLLTALISIDLAIINLLPIPALDGGYIMFIIIEKIIGRPLNEEITENISKYCFLALIILMVLIIFNDIFALVTKKF